MIFWPNQSEGSKDKTPTKAWKVEESSKVERANWWAESG
jgi:hypothetical protein